MLPIACATAVPRARDPGATQATHAMASDAQAVVALARTSGLLDAAVTERVIDQLVRWKRDVRDRLHDLQAGLQAQLVAFADQAGMIMPDLTVLSTEPVARTESSGFGWRDDPIRHTRSFHSGTDFRGDPGTPVMAAGDGVVKFCGRMGGYGNVVDIDHGGGVITRYAHLRRIETKKTAAVTAGQVIGQVGSTGRTTGPHLHFEVRLDGAPVSPIAAMAVATMQRDLPIAGRFAALVLSPELQSTAESDVDPPKQRGKSEQRPERTGRGVRRQVLW
ncbi:MAG TPA: M23 family metallopeptidase [Kofleriaceae bacterium]|nr:M23 family metallopeptidase [Kofleriaceae bacterium]